jgi:hypothetical protein
MVEKSVVCIPLALAAGIGGVGGGVMVALFGGTSVLDSAFEDGGEDGDVLEEVCDSEVLSDEELVSELDKVDEDLSSLDDEDEEDEELDELEDDLLDRILVFEPS